MKKWLILLLLPLLTACSFVKYSFSGTSIQADVKTIAIPYVEYKALRVNPSLSNSLTEALKDKFRKLTRLEQVEMNGDLELVCEITGYDVKATAVTANEVAADRSMLENSLTEPCYPQPDQKLSGRRIHGGYAFWVEDESEVHSTNERLQEANELLESENTLIEYENKQKEENAYLRSRHHIYHEIAEKMYPYQKRIEEMLNGATPGSDGFRESIAEVSVLNAFVKRKTNLLLLASENDAVEIR